MKCIYCKQEINCCKEKYRPFGCDGEFIHDDCREAQNEEIDRFCSITDKEFYRWIHSKE